MASLSNISAQTITAQTTTDQVANFQLWIGHGPKFSKKIGDGKGQYVYKQFDLFNQTQFRQELDQIIPQYKEQEILQEYDFIQNVTAVDEWLVIIDQHRQRAAEDIVIILPAHEAKIAVICRSHIITGWYVYDPNRLDDPPAIMEIDYYQRDGQPVHVSRPVSENCANGDAQLAVERWQAAVLAEKEK